MCNSATHVVMCFAGMGGGYVVMCSDGISGSAVAMCLDVFA